MTPNPIIQEIHRTREEYSKRFGDDLKAICNDARNKQGRDGHRVVSASPKLIGLFTPAVDRPDGVKQNPAINQSAI
jgi:hypothetical protein